MVGEKKEDIIQLAMQDGRIVPAVEVDFKQVSEPWVTVELSDGTEARVRTEVVKAYRLVDICNPMTGEPGYQFEFHQDVRAKVPHHLWKKPSKPSNQEVA